MRAKKVAAARQNAQPGHTIYQSSVDMDDSVIQPKVPPLWCKSTEGAQTVFSSVPTSIVVLHEGLPQSLLLQNEAVKMGLGSRHQHESQGRQARVACILDTIPCKSR